MGAGGPTRPWASGPERDGVAPVGSYAPGGLNLEVEILEVDGSDGMSTNENTVKSYDASAAVYAEEAAAIPGWVSGEIDAFVDAVGGTGRILEIGSGGGRDARELERRGLSVRCTDVAQGFVDLLRADGFAADRLDPLTDDLADPQRPDTPYDGVWSCACLFHVARDDLVTVLGRLAEATRSGGRVHASFKEGDGEDRSTYGTADAPRRYTDTLWREPDLRSEFARAGWVVDEVGRHGEKPWLAVRGHRP
jgi:SAM-dependent methyltransferase